LGVGAALASGSGVAHADTTGSDASSSSSSSSTGATKSHSSGTARVASNQPRTAPATSGKAPTASVAKATSARLSARSTPRKLVDAVPALPAAINPAAAQAVPATAVDPTVAAVVNLGGYVSEALAASPNGRYVYVASVTPNMSAGAVVVIDTTTNKVAKTIKTDFAVTSVAVAPDGRVYAAGYRPTSTSSGVGVVVIISSANALSKTINLGASVAYKTSISVAPDGKSVVVGWGIPTNYGVGYNAAVSVISTASQKITRTVTFDGAITDLAVTVDSKSAVVAATNRYPAELLKVDLATGAVTPFDIRAAGSSPQSIALTPGGAFALVAMQSGNQDVAIVSVNSGDVLATFNAGSTNWIRQIRVSADTKYLFAVEDDVVNTIDILGRTVIDTANLGPSMRYAENLVVTPKGRLYVSSPVRFDVVVLTMYPADAAPVASVSVGDPNASTGVVKGTVTANDPNGNALTFSATAPGKGKVTIDKTTGAFTYTPTAAARHAASALSAGAPDKADTFTITVTNSVGTTVSVPVTVVITPKNTAPSSAKAKAGTPNATTGAVTVTVTASDADKDSLSFSASTPSKGTVEMGANGSLTYTPTEQARLDAGAANASAAVKTDTFTVTIGDAHGGTTTLAVKVNVAPITLTPNAQNLYSNIGGANVISAQLVLGSDKKTKRMVVYMSGIIFNEADLAAAYRAVAFGELNPAVSNFIDTMYGEWQPTEIMLVGFSGGGIQLQNYAAVGNSKAAVKTIVLYGAPISKTLDDLGVKAGSTKSVVDIVDLGDLLVPKVSQIAAELSYSASKTDKGAIALTNTTYFGTVEGNLLGAGNHDAATYRQAAKLFDAFVKSSSAGSDLKNINKDMQRFAGTVIDETHTTVKN
jgi:VCBS repeat-containing protein/YVTN family beta-propeller protein